MPPAQEYQEKKAQLEELKRLDDQGKIDLYYFWMKRDFV